MFKEKLDKLVLRVFCDLQNIVDGKGGRLYIPIIGRQNTRRISEQELRQLFIQEFLNDDSFKSYCYSIETPTILNYRFTSGGHLIKPSAIVKESNTQIGGRCANIDLTIFDGDKRVAIIEFKANNAGYFEHAKDFVKLESEPGEDLFRLFIEVYSQTDPITLKNIYEKLFMNEYGNIGRNSLFYGYSLNHRNDEIHNGLISCMEDHNEAIIKSI